MLSALIIIVVITVVAAGIFWRKPDE